MKAFAVIYRGFVLPGKEKDYVNAWSFIANYFIKYCGAKGSSLHRSQAGEYIAYSRWPNKELRDRYWSNESGGSADLQVNIQVLKNCIDTSKPSDEICMDVIEDLLNK